MTRYKKYYKKKPTKNHKVEVRDFLSQFGIRVHFIKSGWSSAGGDLIEIDIREAETIQRLWSIVFHEFGHIYCERNGLYKIYHNNSLPKKKLAKYIRRYGLRAERFVDKLGKRFMNEHFPDIPFIPAYNTKAEVVWYYKWVERNFKI